MLGCRRTQRLLAEAFVRKIRIPDTVERVEAWPVWKFSLGGVDPVVDGVSIQRFVLERLDQRHDLPRPTTLPAVGPAREPSEPSALSGSEAGRRRRAHRAPRDARLWTGYGPPSSGLKARKTKLRKRSIRGLTF